MLVEQNQQQISFVNYSLNFQFMHFFIQITQHNQSKTLIIYLLIYSFIHSLFTVLSMPSFKKNNLQKIESAFKEFLLQIQKTVKKIKSHLYKLLSLDLSCDRKMDINNQFTFAKNIQNDLVRIQTLLKGYANFNTKQKIHFQCKQSQEVNAKIFQFEDKQSKITRESPFSLQLIGSQPELLIVKKQNHNFQENQIQAMIDQKKQIQVSMSYHLNSLSQRIQNIKKIKKQCLNNINKTSKISNHY